MSRSTGPARGFLGLAVVAILIALIALPTLAASPSASPAATPAATAAAPAATAAPTAKTKPDTSLKPDKPDKAAKPEKGPETAVTLTGTVGTRTDADGNAEYTLTTGGKTLKLDGGPPWFYGDNHPLKPYVGKQVTITGSQRAGEDEVEVDAVNGKALRAPGKPPWAGGWKRVGERHPGWSQEKWDRWQAKAKALGIDCFPPGQCKNKAAKNGSTTDDMTGADAGD